MSLQLILGNSGSGKTHYLYEEIIRKSLEQPDKNFIILVPEQYTMATQKELVKRHPKGGILNIDVLSLGRLAHRIYSELGMEPGLILDDEGKNLVLRKISKNYENDLKILGKNLKKFGYISEVKSLISEFSQYDLGIDGLTQLLDNITAKPSSDQSPEVHDKSKDTTPHINQESMLAYKLEDIKKVYTGFQEYLAGKYITGEEHLDGFTEVVPQSTILKNSIIALDGFTGFTPVQNRLLEALLKVVDTIYATVTIDEKNAKEAYINDWELFALSKEMIETLTRLATENHIKVEPSIAMFTGSHRRHVRAKELAFLEKHLFRYSKEKYNPETNTDHGEDINTDTDDTSKHNGIHLQASLSPWEESLWVAHKVRELVRTQGYRYSDIAIVASDMNVYDGCMKRALEAYDIPVFSDTKRSVLLNSFIEYLRSLLEMVESNYGYQETFRYLKSGMTIIHTREQEPMVGEGLAPSNTLPGYGIFTDHGVDKLENHVLKYGIKGFKNWQQPWGVNCNPKEEELYQQLNGLRVEFVEHITLLHTALKQNRKNVRDICSSLYEFFQEQQLQEKVEQRSNYFNTCGELALEKEYTQVYGIILELMDKFVAILGEEKVSLREYIELLDAGLEEARIGIIPPSSDTIILGDLQRTRVDNIKALFYVGVSDVYVPGKMNHGGLLSEREREKLETMDVKLKPSAKVQMYLQKFYLYLVLTKPSEKLYISYAKSNSKGSSARPAYLINELTNMFPQLKIETEELSLETLELSPKVGLDFVVQGFKNKELRDSKGWQELYNWYMNPEHNVAMHLSATDKALSKDHTLATTHYTHKIELIKEALYYKRLEMSLEDKTAKDLYGALLQNSVSRLEKYAACPYAHFLNYGLRLREREVYEFQASDIGTVLHDAMEDYARRVEDAGKLWGDLSEEERHQWAEEAIDGRVKDYNNHVFQKSSRDEYMVHRMKRLMHRSIWAMTQQLSCGDFVPKGFEVSFGFPGDHKGTGEVELSPGTKMQLRGKIDRVDLWEDDDKILVKVVDYKTGKKELSLESMYHGLQLQLFVYLDAAMKHYTLQQNSQKPQLSGESTVEDSTVEHLTSDLVIPPNKVKEVLPAGVFYYRVDDPIVVEKQDQPVTETILHTLNLDGLVNDGAIHLMDKEMEGKSYAVPVAKTSKGALTKASKNMDQSQLLDVMNFAHEKVKELGREIVDGNIQISPYKKGEETGCDYCKYHNICGFDTAIGTYEYRELRAMKKEDVLTEIRTIKDEQHPLHEPVQNRTSPIDQPKSNEGHDIDSGNGNKKGGQ